VIKHVVKIKKIKPKKYFEFTPIIKRINRVIIERKKEIKSEGAKILFFFNVRFFY
tara:strand:- start:3723 stop:3887 length:165 start_codon:yes stop_codon:yes gene_type:complete